MGAPVLDEIQFTEHLPRLALAPRLRPVVVDLALERRRSILLVSARHDDVQQELRRRDAVVTAVESLTSAVEHLAAGSFDVAAFDPEMIGALGLVRQLKLNRSGHSMLKVDPADLLLARTRHRDLPVFILPLPRDKQYAVIVRAPDLAYLEEEIPLVDALMRIDARQLRGTLRGRHSKPPPSA